MKEDLGQATAKLQGHEDKLFQIQTNTKNNFDKLLEENELLVSTYNKFAAEVSSRLALLFSY